MGASTAIAAALACALSAWTGPGAALHHLAAHPRAQHVQSAQQAPGPKNRIRGVPALGQAVTRGQVRLCLRGHWGIERWSCRSAPGEREDKFVLQEARSDQGHASYRRYHYAMSQLAAADNGTLSFISTDAQGSTSDITSASGTVTKAEQYDAWGKNRNGTAPTASEPKLGYTGHQFDPETGLIYARARYYDSDLGVFLSRDPVGAGPKDAPNLNRYHYGRGNPLAYTDITGQCVDIYSSTGFSMANCIAAAQAAAGFVTGAAKVAAGAVAAPLVASYALASADLYAATGDETFKAGADTFNEGLQGLVDTVSHPIDTISQGVEAKGQEFAKAIDKGDAYGAGQTTGEVTTGTVMAVEGGVATGRALVRGGANLAERVATALARDAEEGGGCIGTSCQVGSGQCFIAGTPVLTESGLKPIETVQLGELLLSMDEQTGQMAWKPVVQRFVTPHRAIVDVKVVDPNGQVETIGVTPGHHFWTRDRGWVQAGDLQPGEEMWSAQGVALKVVGEPSPDENQTVYNFEVADFHTYFAGAEEVWVHNTWCAGETYDGRTSLQPTTESDLEVAGQINKGRYDRAMTRSPKAGMPDGLTAKEQKKFLELTIEHGNDSATPRGVVEARALAKLVKDSKGKLKLMDFSRDAETDFIHKSGTRYEVKSNYIDAEDYPNIQKGGYNLFDYVEDTAGTWKQEVNKYLAKNQHVIEDTSFMSVEEESALRKQFDGDNAGLVHFVDTSPSWR